MKRFIFFARVYALLLLGVQEVLYAQDSLQSYPNYVVIGAFAYKDNAVQFTAEANKNDFPAKFEINPNRNLFYVYVLSTADRQFAFEEARKLRTDTKYFDTWVYNGVLGAEALIAGAGQNQDLNPETGGQLSAVRAEELNVKVNNNTAALTQTDGQTGTAVSGAGTTPTVEQPGVATENANSQGGRKNRRRNSPQSEVNTQSDQLIASAGQDQQTGDRST